MRFEERSLERAALLNPAFVSLLIAHSSLAFAESAKRDLDWVLAFLIPPLILHRETRDALPRNAATSLGAWVQRHPSLRASFPARAASTTQITREALRFALANGVIELSGAGAIRPGKFPHRAPPSATPEVQNCVSRSKLVGRVFAKTNDTATTMAALGVQP